MIALPQPTKIFQSFWEFGAERHKVWQSRRSGKAAPWTSNPFLSGHKFCNSFRVLDRVSQYLVAHVINSGPQTPSELLFRTLLFKFYNKISTWELLERKLGVLEWRRFQCSKYSRVLDVAYNRGLSLFGRAYRANQRWRLDLNGTHQKYLALLVHVMQSDTLARLLAAGSYEECFWMLRGLPLHGDFIGMQILTDLNYSSLLNYDEDSYVRCGPGCVKGINLCFGTRLSDKSSSDMLLAAAVVRDCVDNQEKYFEALDLEPVSLFGRRLKLIDAQNLMCEFFKFSKLKFPNLHSEGASVKSYDAAKAPPLPPLMLPAKWGIILPP
jgi:alpha-glutamyl/putrescinyl thymine pyrophosphorylase clade 1